MFLARASKDLSKVAIPWTPEELVVNAACICEYLDGWCVNARREGRRFTCFAATIERLLSVSSSAMRRWWATVCRATNRVHRCCSSIMVMSGNLVDPTQLISSKRWCVNIAAGGLTNALICSCIAYRRAHRMPPIHSVPCVRDYMAFARERALRNRTSGIIYTYRVYLLIGERSWWIACVPAEEVDAKLYRYVMDSSHYQVPRDDYLRTVFGVRVRRHLKVRILSFSSCAENCLVCSRCRYWILYCKHLSGLSTCVENPEQFCLFL